MTALHACDTATDDAIAFGLPRRRGSWCWCRAARPRWRPACARHKALALARTPLAELWRHPLHTREIGSQLTNVLRCLYLEAMRLPGDRDRAGRLGAQHEERADHRAPHRPAQAQRGRAAAGDPGRVRPAATLRRPLPYCREFGVRFQIHDARWPACPASPSPAIRTTSSSAATTGRPIFVDAADHETAARRCWTSTHARMQRGGPCLRADEQPLPPAGDARRRPRASRR